MKKIIMFGVLVLTFGSSHAQVDLWPFNKKKEKPIKKELSKIEITPVIAYNLVSLSDLLPGTELEVEGSGGEKTRFQLTLLRLKTGETAPTYVPPKVLNTLKKELPPQDSINLLVGDVVSGLMMSGQSLGVRSIFTPEEMNKLTPEQKRIAENYETSEKFIVWDVQMLKVRGVIDEDLKIKYKPQQTGSPSYNPGSSSSGSSNTGTSTTTVSTCPHNQQIWDKVQRKWVCP